MLPSRALFVFYLFFKFILGFTEHWTVGKGQKRTPVTANVLATTMLSPFSTSQQQIQTGPPVPPGLADSSPQTFQSLAPQQLQRCVQLLSPF